MRVSRLPSGPPKLSEPQLRTIIKRVLGTPVLQAYLGGLAHLGVDPAKVEASALQKVAHLALRKAPRLSTANRVRALEKKIARANPIEAVEFRRQLEFARLERDSQ